VAGNAGARIIRQSSTDALPKGGDSASEIPGDARSQTTSRPSFGVRRYGLCDSSLSRQPEVSRVEKRRPHQNGAIDASKVFVRSEEPLAKLTLQG